MSDPFDVADGGGGDFVPKTLWDELGEEKALAAFRILRIMPRRKLKENDPKSNEVDPVVVDMVVLSGKHEGMVYFSEELIHAGFVRTLREKKSEDGKTTLPRERGQVVVGHFDQYDNRRSGGKANCINPATSAEVALARQVFKDTGNDPWEFYAKRALTQGENEANGARADRQAIDERAAIAAEVPVGAGAAGAPTADKLPF